MPNVCLLNLCGRRVCSSCAQVGAWSRRYFVLHGALLAYYDDETAAAGPDESRCLYCGLVLEATRWETGALKPAQVRS